MCLVRARIPKLWGILSYPFQLNTCRSCCCCSRLKPSVAVRGNCCTVVGDVQYCIVHLYSMYNSNVQTYSSKYCTRSTIHGSMWACVLAKVTFITRHNQIYDNEPATPYSSFSISLMRSRISLLEVSSTSPANMNSSSM